MTVAFLIVRRNQKLEDVPLEHTIIGTTEVIGIAPSEEARDMSLQQYKGAHALELKLLPDMPQPLPHMIEPERVMHSVNVLDDAIDTAVMAAGDALAFKPTDLLEEEDA